jgi:hypothetical protein
MTLDQAKNLNIYAYESACQPGLWLAGVSQDKVQDGERPRPTTKLLTREMEGASRAEALRSLADVLGRLGELAGTMSAKAMRAKR